MRLGLRFVLSMSCATAIGMVVMPAWAVTSWTLPYSSPNSGNALISLSAVDGDHAWAIGVESQMGSSSPVGVKTSDGANWVKFMLPPGFVIYNQIAFSTTTNGWLAGAAFESFLYKSTSGGASWELALKPSEPIEHLQALADGSMFAVGGKTLVRSTDGQQVDSVEVTVPGGMSLKAVHMLSSQTGYVAASASGSSAVLWTADSGQTWETRASWVDMEVVRLSFVDPQQGWAAANNGSAGVIAKTTDGGKTWTSTSVPDHPKASIGDVAPVTSCTDVRFFDAQRGVAACLACTAGCDQDAGESPSLLTVLVRSADGGATWAMDPDYEPAMNAPPFGALMVFSGMFAMAFPDPNHGYLAGQNNLILRFVADNPEPGVADSGSGGGGGGAGNGSSPESSNSGCGCRVQHAHGAWVGWLVLAGMCSTLGMRRRRSPRLPVQNFSQCSTLDRSRLAALPDAGSRA